MYSQTGKKKTQTVFNPCNATQRDCSKWNETRLNGCFLKKVNTPYKQQKHISLADFSTLFFFFAPLSSTYPGLPCPDMFSPTRRQKKKSTSKIYKINPANSASFYSTVTVYNPLLLVMSFTDTVPIPQSCSSCFLSTAFRHNFVFGFFFPNHTVKKKKHTVRGTKTD